MTPDPLLLAPDRRHKIVEIGYRRYRVREPAPFQGLEAVQACTELFGPVLVKVFSGTLALKANGKCPACGNSDQTKLMQINGSRWLCQAPVGDSGGKCAQVWNQQPALNENGEPVVVDLQYAATNDTWRSVLAMAIADRIKALEADHKAVAKLARASLIGGLDVAIPHASESAPTVEQTWVPINNEDDFNAHVQTVGDLLTLGREAMACWVLPTLRDVNGGTSRDSVAKKTRGASTQAHRATAPDRAPPPIATRRG